MFKLFHKKSISLIVVLIFISIETDCKQRDHEEDSENKIIVEDKTIDETNNVLKNGEFYHIQSVPNELSALSAPFEGKRRPSPTVLRKWEGLPSQIWEVYKTDDDGVILTPVDNDFNSITSFLEGNAHGYNVWTAEKVQGQSSPSRKSRKQKQSNYGYLLRNSKLFCLEAHGSNNPITFKVCNVSSPGQYWKFHVVKL